MATVKLDPQSLLGFRLSTADGSALTVKLGEKAGNKEGGKGIDPS